MYIELVFYVMLLGHVLSDFYFQTDELAEEKEKSYKAVLFHSVLYSFGFAAVFCICCFHRDNSFWNNLPLVILASVFHFIIDSLKFVFKAIINEDNKGSLVSNLRKKPIIDKLYEYTKNHNISGWILAIDQIAHITTLLVTYYLCGTGICTNRFVSQEYEHLPYLPIIIILGIFCLLKPVSIFISRTALWNQKGEKDDVQPATIKTGKIIGYLERLVIFFLVIYNHIEVIGFVLAAKSLARYKELEERKKAEYFLIGTLISVVSVFAITMLLGLCKVGM